MAPKFAVAVREALGATNAAGLDAVVYEAHRSQELQALYYARGRTIIPPVHTVTNAPTNLHSWHGYGLAVDIVHRTKFWEPPGGEAWFRHVADIFKQHRCKWGGDWTKPDTPHFQWHLCKPSPSDEARRLMLTGGFAAVWQAVGAD
ncbi:M15 family metallopeptidase [Segnochrobactrum spirostomi]|uniref:M15 family metallopeptidase n=1 Tax=Segnochrobactrum spirostomi TaxID=2608987 RepID=UPI001AD8000F|nr:M15 family metallopeptidase [Segnochrobactrum spirostomi]